MAPQTPQSLGTPRRSRGAPRGRTIREHERRERQLTHGELGEAKVGVEEAGEAFTGGGDRLRLLGDRVERERAVQ